MTETRSLNWPRIIIQSSLLALALLIVPVLLIVLIAILRIRPFTQSFFAHAQLDQAELVSRLQTGWNQEPPVANGKFTIVVLGTDELPNRPDMPIMTDTIMLASVDLNQGTVKTIAIPRDYWSERYQTKINSLYEYGRKQNPSKPYDLLLQEIATLTPAQVRAVITISPVKLGQFIDALGGVEVDVPTGFVDTRFPRDDVDITTVRDPKKLYETIEFKSGKQNMTGHQALQYIRSRHGSNGQDNDIARAERQAVLLQAIARQMTQAATIKNPEILGELWQFYQREFDSAVPIETLVSLAHYRVNQVGWRGTLHDTVSALTDFSVFQETVPVTRYNRTSKKIETGLLINPPMNKRQYQGQWVYVATNSAALSKYVTAKLGYD